MILKHQILSLMIPIFLLSLSITESSNCNQSCGDKRVPYPFGFSAGCQIHLNCSSDGQQQQIAGFPIRNINDDHIKIRIDAACSRPLRKLHHLYGPNYSPTSRNAILLQNCSAPVACMIPSTPVYTHFEALSCAPNSSNITSCYSQNEVSDFLDYENLTRTNCKSFLSSISAESFNESGVLEIEVVELGWWLQGRCSDDFCSENTNCVDIVSPFNGRPGNRCKCKKGFVGDGYRAGAGCRKASSDCNPSRYISGKCGGTTRIAVLVGGIVGGASLMICALLVCCFVQRQSNSRAKDTGKRLLYEASDISIPIYPYRDIEKATNSFSEKQRLGNGAFGTVYAGKLHDNSWVAIKRIKNRDTNCIEQVINEIKLISSVNHPNLVRLLGCSIENGEQILVYEFMPNGTLCQHLQRERGHGLPWPVRLTIAAETALAIAHLHSDIDPPIYHRDIKSSNILLDYNFRSKLADFGLSRLGKTEISHISTAPQGTPGYLDPQYHQNFHLSDKSDVYSFGVVLIEIITALKVVDFTRPPNEINLAGVATDRISKGRLDEIIDPFLKPNCDDSWTLSSIHKVAELAFRCLSFHRDMRPTMMEVAVELEQIRLSRWISAEEIACAASSELSPSSSSSNLSEQPLSLAVNKKSDAAMENRGLFMLQMSNVECVNFMEKLKDKSPVSVQDPWLSEQSSPSSSSLLNNATH